MGIDPTQPTTPTHPPDQGWVILAESLANPADRPAPAPAPVPPPLPPAPALAPAAATSPPPVPTPPTAAPATPTAPAPAPARRSTRRVVAQTIVLGAAAALAMVIALGLALDRGIRTETDDGLATGDRSAAPTSPGTGATLGTAPPSPPTPPPAVPPPTVVPTSAPPAAIGLEPPAAAPPDPIALPPDSTSPPTPVAPEPGTSTPPPIATSSTTTTTAPPPAPTPTAELVYERRPDSVRCPGAIAMRWTTTGAPTVTITGSSGAPGPVDPDGAIEVCGPVDREGRPLPASYVLTATNRDGVAVRSTPDGV